MGQDNDGGWRISPDDFHKLYEWRWSVEWFGWRRCVWFAAAADFYHFMFVVVLFGVAITYGWQMKRSILAESIGTN